MLSNHFPSLVRIFAALTLLYGNPTYAIQWNFLDTIEMYYLDSTAADPDWSFPITVYRATNREPENGGQLGNRNAGNYAAQVKFLNGYKENRNHQKPGSYQYLQAFQVSVNKAYISDYFHCSEGRCEFRLTCLGGPCTTPLTSIRSSYFRTGIKVGIGNYQISACGRSYTCAKDVSLSLQSGQQRVEECGQHGPESPDCFFAFPAGGQGHSYRVLGHSNPVKIDWNQSAEKNIASLLVSG